MNVHKECMKNPVCWQKTHPVPFCPSEDRKLQYLHIVRNADESWSILHGNFDLPISNSAADPESTTGTTIMVHLWILELQSLGMTIQCNTWHLNWCWAACSIVHQKDRWSDQHPSSGLGGARIGWQWHPEYQRLHNKPGNNKPSITSRGVINTSSVPATQYLQHNSGRGMLQYPFLFVDCKIGRISIFFFFLQATSSIASKHAGNELWLLTHNSDYTIIQTHSVTIRSPNYRPANVYSKISRICPQALHS